MGTLRPSVFLVHPDPPPTRGGNQVTADRWTRILRELGCQVEQGGSWDGRACDLLLALHARKSHGSILRFSRAHPDRPLVVAATGTDLYTDVEDGGEARESFGLATRIVVLQPMAIEALPAELRLRARVIHQSVEPPPEPSEPAEDVFEVVTIAHLRPVKDPLAAGRAARLLPAGSRTRIVHVGGVIDPRLGSEAEELVRDCPAFTWLGELPHEKTLEVLGRARLFVSSSRHEGGSNVLSEALAIGVPILATRIPGNLGLLGEAYPGTFAVGDDQALAELISRAETDPGFRSELWDACRERAWVTSPAEEVDRWRRLLSELADAGKPNATPAHES